MESEKLPNWLPIVFAFLAGIAATYAAISPSIGTTDYQRGTQDGFQIGFEAGSKDAAAMEDVGYQRGLRHGRETAAK